MANSINIDPNVLDWVFKNTSKTFENQKAFQILEQWRIGEKAPTFNQVEDISKVLHVPFGYFFLRQPPQEDHSLLQYRTVQNERFETPSRELVDTIHAMTSVQDWMHEFVKKTEGQPVRVVGSGGHDASVDALANRIRSDLDLPTNWYEMTKDADESFKLLREKCEAAGIIIMMSGIVGNNTRRSLNIEEFRAFTLVDEFAPLIFINATDTMNGRLFSLVHEMAHVWVGQNSVFNGINFNLKENGYIEVKCNAVAAEIIVPRVNFQQIWGTSKNPDINKTVCQLARIFRCSTTVIARRAFDYKYIEKQEYEDIVKQAQIGCVEKVKRDGGNFYTTMATRIDTRLLYALASSVSNGTTLHTEAYKLTNTNRTTFSKLVELMRG